MPYREREPWVAHARRSSAVRPGAPRRLGHVNCLSAATSRRVPLLHRGARDEAHRLARRGRGLVPHRLRPPRDGADRQGRRRTSTTSPSTSSTSARCASRSTTSAATAAGSAGGRPATASAATSPPTSGSSRRRASSSCTATWSSCRPTTSRATGPTTASPPTPGGRCRPAPTSASTRRRSSRSARASRCSAPAAAAPPRAHVRERAEAMSLHGYTVPRSPEGRASLVPPPALALRRRLPGHRLPGRPGRGRRRAAAEGLEPHPDAGPLRRRVRRLAVVLGGRRRAARPRALAVPRVLHRRERAARRRAGDDLPVHLGRPGLRARARLDPGLPQEARLDLDDARASASTARPTPGCARRDASAAPAPPAGGGSPRAR